MLCLQLEPESPLLRAEDGEKKTVLSLSLQARSLFVRVTHTGASSKESCELCNDGQSSLGGSHVCDLSLANSRKTLVIYLIVGASTLAAICITYYTWQKKGESEKFYAGPSSPEDFVFTAVLGVLG